MFGQKGLACVIGDLDHIDLGIERRADVAVSPVGRKDLHARPVRCLDAGRLSKSGAVEYGNVVLAAHRHPDLLAIRREEGFVRRAAHIGRVLHHISGRVDEGHSVGADRDHRKRLPIGREAHAMDQHLPLVERAEVHRLRIAEADDAEQLVVSRVNYGNRIGELLGRINPVLVADGNVGIASCERRLACEGRERAPGEK
jgi:hypothetical protein